MNYAEIKELAKQSGKRITDLIALSPNRDPFYCGTRSDIKDAEWFVWVWETIGHDGKLYLRRVHYWIVGRSPSILMPNGTPYVNTLNCWKFLCDVSAKARYLDLVEVDEIIDHKHPSPHFYIDLQDYGTPLEYTLYAPDGNPYVEIKGQTNDYVQPYHLEVWIEKSTMNDILLPLCERYHTNLCAFQGEVSVTACSDLVKRIQQIDKPVRIFYISDHDFGGNNMPVSASRKIEFFLQKQDLGYLDVRIKQLAITPQQIKKYNLPKKPMERDLKRGAIFEENFGEGVVELDALEGMHKGVLADLISKALATYYSDEAEEKAEEQQELLRRAVSDQIKAITSKYQRQIKALEKMRTELEEIDVDTSDYDIDRYPPHVEENAEDWVFDSQRDYLSQIERYKAHKRNGHQ